MIAEFLESAHRTCLRLCESAQIAGSECTWVQPRADQAWSRTQRVLFGSTEGGFYNGTAGIGYVLLQAGRTTGDDRILKVGELALRHALRTAQRDGRPSIAMHTGAVGVALALCQSVGLPCADEFLAGAEGLLAGLPDDRVVDSAYDIIAGSAGAIPALLQIAAVLGPRPRMIAFRMADHLIASANLAPAGWSWGRQYGAPSRNLLGYGHGVAGIGHGLLEAYVASGAGAFLEGAECAFAYEDAHFDALKGNWPDYRQPEIAELLAFSSAEELKREIRAGRRFDTAARFMTAWCHGAAGIAPTRARAMELTGRSRYLDMVEHAIRSTRASLTNDMAGLSLCHGHFGNADSLLTVARLLGRADLELEIREFAAQKAARHDWNRQGWPSGAINGLPDPSLMLGDAGVAHFLLRCADPSIGSVLFQCAPRGHWPDAASTQPADLRKRWVREFIGGTCAKWAESVGRSVDLLAPPQDDPATAIDRAVGRVQELVCTQPVLPHDVRDALQLDAVRLQVAKLDIDTTREFIDRLMEADEFVDDTELCLTPYTKLVPIIHGEDRPSARDAVGRLVSRQGTRVVTQPLSRFAWVLASHMQTSVTLRELIDLIADEVEGTPDSSAVRNAILQQLDLWKGSPFLRIHRPEQLSQAGA